MAQWGQLIPSCPVVLRSVVALSATCLSAFVASAGPVFAQAAATPPAASQPASINLMNDLTLAAAVGVCNLAVEQKVPVQAAVIALSQGAAYVVSAKYGSEIAGSGKLEVGQIVNGTIVQVVAQVKQGCYPKVTAADQKFVDTLLADFTKQLKSKQK
ncbi:hypothetical protein [Cyanobium sp. WAJ14-Wanaka]|uniref:hypothetical protein n=1 Tax=Cyanobium sp. WAJ14-Wanaka TaxID=2823725 RepID=UPI0020CE1375|nr:hypothetical protein [Cyanobium sp. WAJ14-Wanaka]MCP9774770.1 hypothetical protein [Cyanobium sp. WAJ14-Wanaka]